MQTKAFRVSTVVALLALAACGQEQATSALPSAAAASGGNAGRKPLTRAVASGDLPSYFLRKWSVCDTFDVNGQWDHHVPKGDPTFQIVELDSDSGWYALQFDEPAKWEQGWKELVLNKVGTNAAYMPPGSWVMAKNCKQDNQMGGGSNMEVDANTIRLRGAVCLPEGRPDPIHAECSNDTDVEKHYNEVVIFVRPESSTGVPHMVIQHCARGELVDTVEGGTKKVVCKPKKEEDDRLRIRAPHPGHIHLDDG